MTTQANWFSNLTTAVDDDVFGPRVQDVGKPIDLQDAPKLNERLMALLQREQELAQAGTTCDVRDQNDSICSACPLRQTDPLEATTALCNVGVEMERTLTKIAIARVSGRAPT